MKRSDKLQAFTVGSLILVAIGLFVSSWNSLITIVPVILLIPISSLVIQANANRIDRD